MSTLQIVTTEVRRYLCIVESSRDPVTQRPKLLVLRHLGRADDALATLTQADHLHLAARTHGAVAEMWQLAQTLDLAALIDTHVAPEPARHDGPGVGQSHATSKRGFAAWAATTTLGALAGGDVTRLTS